jgi:hypothetical protein
VRKICIHYLAKFIVIYKEKNAMKYLLIIALLIILVTTAGCISSSHITTMPNTQKPVTTICQMKCNDFCLDDKVEKCSYDRLTKQGYRDCVDCMANHNDFVCDNVDRYNAEVDARNECWNQTYPDKPLRFYFMHKVKIIK